MHVVVYMLKSEDIFLDSLHPYVGPRDRNEAMKLSSKYLYSKSNPS